MVWGKLLFFLNLKPILLDSLTTSKDMGARVFSAHWQPFLKKKKKTCLFLIQCALTCVFGYIYLYDKVGYFHTKGDLCIMT